MFVQPQDKEIGVKETPEKRREKAPSLTSSVSHAFDKETKEVDLFDKLPSLPEVLEEDRRVEKERKSAPLCTTRSARFSLQESPVELVRSSMCVVPADEDMFDMLGLPMFMIAQPFNDGAAVPEFKAAALVRCMQCLSFPTPGTDAHTFRCTICGADNKISVECPSQHEPTVDYVVEDTPGRSGSTQPDAPPSTSGPFSLHRKWREPCVIFALDVTPASKQAPGYSEYLGCVKDLLNSSDFSFLYRRFGVVLVGESPYVISSRDAGYMVNKVYSVEGAAGVCSPWLIEVNTLTESRVLELVEIVDGFTEPKADLSAGVAAVAQLVSYTGGGRVLLWLGGREYAYAPADKAVQTVVECGASLSLFTGPRTEIEKASKICHSTNGSIERESISAAMTDKVIREGFFRCSIRIVASNGLKKRSVYSSGCTESISRIHFPEMSALTTFAVSFSVDDLIKEGSAVYIQTVVDYVNIQGEKRVRVINLKLRASRVIQQIFLGMAVDSMFCGLAKYICSEPVNMLERIRKTESAMVASLSLYKRACAKETSSQQLVLPETIKILPLLIQSILKYPRIHLGIESRVEAAGEIMPLSVERTLRVFYPRLAKVSSLFTISSVDGITGERLSMRVLDENDTYLLDTGSKIILWFGRGAAGLAEEMLQSDVVQGALSELKEVYGTHLKTAQYVQGEQDAGFIGYMVEDQMGGYPSYQKYLGILHSKICKK